MVWVIWVMGSIIVILILLIIGIALFLWIVSTYNNLVSIRVRVDNAWSDVDVHLKRRADLIPNLVETVKGYASHERNTLEAVIKARSSVIVAKDLDQRFEAENFLTQALRQLLVVIENYPELKANENFMALQKELTDIEEEIAKARRYYNAVVRDYNTSIQVFPNVIIANYLGFKPAPFFEARDEDREVPRVKF
jgi:LemA protein